ncbi:hypothetical protein ACFFUC_09805 [Paracoccus cavernae]
MSVAPHDVGVVRQRLRSEIHNIACRGAQTIEPIARGLEGHAEMHGAQLFGLKAVDHEQRPTTPKNLRLESAERAVIAATAAVRPAPPIKRTGMGRLASRDLSLANTHLEDAVMRAVRYITA